MKLKSKKRQTLDDKVAQLRFEVDLNFEVIHGLIERVCALESRAFPAETILKDVINLTVGECINQLKDRLQTLQQPVINYDPEYLQDLGFEVAEDLQRDKNWN